MHVPHTAEHLLFHYGTNGYRAAERDHKMLPNVDYFDLLMDIQNDKVKVENLNLGM